MLTENQKIVLDEMTPIFTATMDELPPQKRKVLASLASINGIATSREVAKAARISINIASMILVRLLKDGFIADYSSHVRKKQYDFSYKHKWLAIWLRVRRTGDNK